MEIEPFLVGLAFALAVIGSVGLSWKSGLPVPVFLVLGRGVRARRRRRADRPRGRLRGDRPSPRAAPSADDPRGSIEPEQREDDDGGGGGRPSTDFQLELIGAQREMLRRLTEEGSLDPQTGRRLERELDFEESRAEAGP